LDPLLDRLIDLVAGSQPGPGGETRVSPERELADKLGINRSSLREKMAVLEALGFITRAQGSGTFLSIPRSNFHKYYYEVALRLGSITIEQLQQAREMLEMEMVCAASVNAHEEDVKALEYFLNRMLGTADAEYGADLDVAFHMALGAATHNPVIMILLEDLSFVLRRVYKERRLLVSRAPRGLAQTDATHIDILKAVREHDQVAARVAMANHFAVWRDFAEKAKNVQKEEQAGNSKGVDGLQSCADVPDMHE
jgi:GntR family transcriptional repressor for pyruvate dehydrogenase complex